MRSDVRAWVVSILLAGLWGTVLTYPFRLVSDLISKTSQTIVGGLHLPAIVFAVLVLFLIMGITCLALFLGRQEVYQYYALGLSVLSGIIYCVKVITTRQYSIEAAFVALVIALPIVLVLLHLDEWTRYIADAFVMALPVSMFYDCVMNPLFRLLKANIYMLKPFIVVPKTGIFSKVNTLLHMPPLVWGCFFYIIALLPVLYLSGGRKEGKIRE